METINRRQKKDIRLIGKFVEVYCGGKHAEVPRKVHQLPADAGSVTLCDDCSGFLDYAVQKRLTCPLEKNKPICKRCHVHCYGGLQREKIREIMSYSGRRIIMRGRLDYLWHYLL
jgi:hypothetical protein